MLKAFLKRFFPASFHKIERSEDKIITELRAEIMKLEKSITELSIVAQKAEVNSWRAQQNAAEAVWANVFHDSISGEGFIKDKQFFPGRWAVGYPALYAIFRVLQNFRPKRILELGLGQSTRIIGQYAQNFSDVSHTVVEQDESWISFFKSEFPLPSNTTVVHLDYVLEPYRDVEVLQYRNFSNEFAGKRFDFIFIDAPLGGEMKNNSRVDILNLLPGCLDRDFVLMLDDYNRQQEKNTFAEMEHILTENGISYRKGIYTGQKQTALLCSESLSFLASL